MNLNGPRRAAALAAAAGLVVTLGACSAQPGQALVVNDVSYSTADVEASTLQLTDMLGQEVAPAGLVGALAQAELVDEIAQRLDITVDEQAIDDFLTSAVEQGSIVAAPEGGLENGTRAYLRMVVESQQLQALSQDPTAVETINSAWTEISQNVDVTVNPRFGTWDPAGGGLDTSARTFADVVSSAQLGSLTGTETGTSTDK